LTPASAKERRRSERASSLCPHAHVSRFTRAQALTAALSVINGAICDARRRHPLRMRRVGVIIMMGHGGRRALNGPPQRRFTIF
jgi:hypothetical protein